MRNRGYSHPHSPFLVVLVPFGRRHGKHGASRHLRPSERFEQQVYVSMIGAQVVRWYVPQRSGFQITIRENAGALRDIRFCSLEEVELDGETLTVSEFISRHAAWFTAPFTNTRTNEIGAIVDYSFELQGRSGFGDCHANGLGGVTICLTIDPAEDHTVRMSVCGKSSFMKIM